MNTPHIGSFRGTRYFVHIVQVGPNSIVVDASEHGVIGSRPARLEIHEQNITDKQRETIHAALTVIEQLYEAEHQRREDELGINGQLARDKAHAFVKTMEDAKAALAVTELESIRIQNEQIVKRSELEQLDEQIERKRVQHEEVEKLRADAVAGAQAEIEALDKTIAAKRVELSVVTEATGRGVK